MKINYLSIFILLINVYGIKVYGQEPAEAVISTDTIAPGVQGSINPLRDNKKVITGDELLDASFPASMPLFGTGIRFRLGGYVKADFIKDFEYVADPYEFELGSIAVEGSPERDFGGTSTFHIKESRVNLDFRSKAKWLNGKEFPLQVFVEIDWFFDSPSMALNTRIRHAYGVIGHLLVGRTWTTSGDLAAIPGTIDFSGGDALYGGRATQIRWQDRIGKSFQYAIALEETFSQIDNPSNFEGLSRPPWPNLAGMIKFQSSKGSTIQLGGDVFPISWNGPAPAPKARETGYALTLTSRIVLNINQNNDSFTWGGGFGKGQAHKIIALSWDGKGSGVLTPDGIDLAKSWFAYAGYNHYWSKSFNSTIATHWAGTDLSPIQSDNTIKRAGSAHANLIWFPYKMVSTGIEYMWGMRENKNDIQGTANRVQFMVKFKFN